MIFRIPASRDCFITNKRVNGAYVTSSNNGRSESLQVFRIAPVSGTAISGSLARSLIQFDLSQYASLTASGEFPSLGSEFYLKLRNLQHGETLPSSYYLEVERLARSFSEGNGLDVVSFRDKGFTNWDKTQTNVWWTTAGGDVTGSVIATQYFDSGEEDLDLDVSNLVRSWLTGGIPNNGFLIHLSSTLETGSVDFYQKSFYSRHTHFPDSAPYLEARFDDSVRDDRSNFVFDNTGSLYLYNIVRGQLTNITTSGNTLLVKINDLSGTIKTVTASFTGLTGIYSASFAIASSSYSGSRFSDIWYSGSNVYMTGAFTPGNTFANSSISQNNYFVNLKAFKNEYELDEKIRFNLFVRPRDYNTSVVLTSSALPTGNVITKGYYRIINDRTKDVVIPFGTGSPETTRLSYDANGNYFNFYMSSLNPGNVYKIQFLFLENGNRQFIDNGFKFKIPTAI